MGGNFFDGGAVIVPALVALCRRPHSTFCKVEQLQRCRWPDEQARAELEWKGSDFCTRSGLVANTVWRWRKGLAPIPPWVSEYLRAVLAVQRLHAEFVAVCRPVRQADKESTAEGESTTQSVQ
jgi:hypothetical protein